MDFENLKRHAYHSLMLYSIVADAPRFLHIPDMINAALDGDMDLLKKDFETVMISCLTDLPKYLLAKVNDNNGTNNIMSWKDEINKKIENLNTENSVEFKNGLIDLINEIIIKLQEQGSSLPVLRKL